MEDEKISIKMSGKTVSKGRGTTSKSQKAGLIFPVSRIHR
jgi:hypothetical protein